MTSRFAWRYFRSKKSTNAINIIAWISMVAIGIVTAALVIVLSVFNGFEDLVKSLYGDFYSDLKVEPVSGKWLKADASLINKMMQVSGVRKAEPVLEERAILVDQEDKSIVWLKGVTAEYPDYSGVSSHLIRGDFETGNRERPGVVLGAGVENALQVMAGREIFPISVYLPNRLSQSPADPLDAIHSANATPTGSFVIQQDFDNQYAFTNKDFLSYMLDLPADQASFVEIFTDSSANISKIKRELEKILGDQFVVKSRYEQNQSLYAAMQAEKLIIYAVAFLILVIAAFNIISSLTMTVLEKQEDIAVLQAMGTSSRRVSTIFLKLGAILAGIGGFAGCILGLMVCIAQQKFHFVKLGGQSFVIDYYPVTMRLSDFLAVTAIVFVIAFFSGWLPSRKASRTEYSLKS